MGTTFAIYSCKHPLRQKYRMTQTSIILFTHLSRWNSSNASSQTASEQIIDYILGGQIQKHPHLRGCSFQVFFKLIFSTHPFHSVPRLSLHCPCHQRYPWCICPCPFQWAHWSSARAPLLWHQTWLSQRLQACHLWWRNWECRDPVGSDKRSIIEELFFTFSTKSLCKRNFYWNLIFSQAVKYNTA